MTAYVFECPECGHICAQEKIPPAPETENDILWQCRDCFVIYTERYRLEIEERKRMRREKQGPYILCPVCGAEALHLIKMEKPNGI